MTETNPSGNFKFSIAEPESWKRVITIEVDGEYFAEEYDKKTKEIRRKVEKPGFRKGKVPVATVQKEFGSEIRMEALDVIVPIAYQAAIVETGIFPVSDPVLDDLKMDEGEPISFSLAVEIRPDVVTKDYEGLSLTKQNPEVTDANVDEVLDRYQDQKADWSVVDREAADGDQLKVDVTGIGPDGEPEEDKTVKDYGFVIGAENNFETFDKGLKGKKAGDETEISTTYPEDYPTEELRNQTVTYKITVNEVAEKSLPELNDEFASSIKEGQTLLELKMDIRENLQKEEDKKARMATEDEIIKALVERNQFDLPPTMIEKQLDASVEQAKQQYSYMGREMTEEDEKQYRELGRDSSEISLKGMFLLGSVRKQEEIQVTDEKLDAHIKEIAQSNGYELEQFLAHLENGNQKEHMAYELADKMAFDFLISRATFDKKAD